MTFAFRELAVAQALKRLVMPRQQAVADGLEDILSRALIYRTPFGGIGPRVGRVCGMGSCTVYMINAEGHLIPYRNSAGETVSLPVYNIATDGVGGEKFIMGKDCLGRAVVDFELCDDDSSWSDSSFNLNDESSDASSSSGPSFLPEP